MLRNFGSKAMNFSENDKRAIVSFFLHSDEIFKYLSQEMFAREEYKFLKQREVDQLNSRRSLSKEVQLKLTSKNSQLLD